ncbi:hypothetical protein K4F52_010169 [Lecanicillium sp. MT-2017a]|nr:hypothetical protein K4F52_010169 [Lecanicillium sp. MT-2017a]
MKATLLQVTLAGLAVAGVLPREEMTVEVRQSGGNLGGDGGFSPGLNFGGKGGRGNGFGGKPSSGSFGGRPSSNGLGGVAGAGFGFNLGAGNFGGGPGGYRL